MPPSSISRAPTPLFFVSIASKGVSFAVSRLFATLTGSAISVAAKGLTFRSLGTLERRENAGGPPTPWAFARVSKERSCERGLLQECEGKGVTRRPSGRAVTGLPSG